MRFLVFLLLKRNAHHYFTSRSKLDGIAYKIDQHLPQPQRISLEKEGDLPVDTQQKLNISATRLGCIQT